MNIQDITHLLLHYKYLIMFVLMFFEWPVVGFISAFLAAKGYFNFGMVYLLSISGDVAGDLLRYWIGRWSRQLGFKKFDIIEEKRNWISKHVYLWAMRIGKRILGRIHALENHSILKYLERNVEKHFFPSLLIVKITPPLSIPGQFAFGFLKVWFRRFTLQTTIVCFLFESIFLNLGYFSSISANTFQSKFDTVTMVISSIFVGLIALYLGFLIMKKIRSLSKEKI